MIRGACWSRRFDGTYRSLTYYVRWACLRPRFRNARVLRQRVKNYCRRRGARRSAEVEEAYTSSTCCPLVDHLNQVCKDMGDSPQTTTAPSTTTTTTLPPSTTTVEQCGGDTCGAMFSGVPGDSGVVQSPNYPCPYPDDAALCTFRIEGTGGATSVTLTFDTFDVDCDDGVRVAQGSPFGTILGPSCTITSGQSVTTTTSSLVFVFLQADVNMPGNTASGFQITYTIN